GHSVALANALKATTKTGDLFMSADAGVNQTLIGSETGDWVKWFVIFARNSIVLAYSPQSKFRPDFERAKNGEIPWYEVLLKPGVKFSRGDPNLDPLAYYNLFVGALAEDYYKIAGLKHQLLGDDNNPQQVTNSPFQGIATGELDALFL